MKHYTVIFIILILFTNCKRVQKQSLKPNKTAKIVTKTRNAPIIDGIASEAIWKASKWYPINQKWLGEVYTSNDFEGQYKLTWDETALYALVKIKDDTLYDQHKDPLKFWWDDDCVEVFIDEDNSGGEHQYNHNAFAYHIALDGNIVDIAPGKIPMLYNNHVQSKRVTTKNITIWELKISLYSDNFIDGEQNTPVTLKSNKKVGFAIAYCDNDSSKERENFIGSEIVEGEDKNRGWIDASIFGTLILKD